MECSLPPTYNTESTATAIKTMQADHIPSKSVLHVNFDTDPEDVHERKKKYLTAKYGQHQMSLIRKRLRVEMWMYEQLQLLYGCRDDAQTYDVEIDLDELLDLEGDLQRREWLRTKLEGAKQPAEVIEKFIAELLQRAKTL